MVQGNANGKASMQAECDHLSVEPHVEDDVLFKIMFILFHNIDVRSLAIWGSRLRGITSSFGNQSS